jgi:hypothetical protein
VRCRGWACPFSKKISEILEDQSKGPDGEKVVGKNLTYIRTTAAAFEESHVVGRDKENDEIIRLVESQD